MSGGIHQSGTQVMGRGGAHKNNTTPAAVVAHNNQPRTAVESSSSHAPHHPIAEIAKLVQWRFVHDGENLKKEVLDRAVEILVVWKRAKYNKDRRQNNWRLEEELQETARHALARFWAEKGGREAVIGAPRDKGTVWVLLAFRWNHVRRCEKPGPGEKEAGALVWQREFLVSWLGYDRDSDSWEPMSNLDPKLARTYLISKGYSLDRDGPL